MLQWLLHMEEHCFYLFLTKSDGFTQHLVKRVPWLYKTVRSRWPCLQCAQMTSKKNFNTILLSATTTHNCLMCAQSWNIAKLSSHFACPWRRTLLSLLHATGTHRRLTTIGRGHFTSSSVEEGQSFFTHALLVYLPASSAQWCLVCLSLHLAH